MDATLESTPGRFAINIPRPLYSGEFRCIGPECEDTCCQAWGIAVDRATYERYQLIPAESLLRAKLDHHLALMPEPRAEAQHAQIVLNESLQCPFLSKEHWCSIHQEYGREYLSVICETYPRVTREVGRKAEESLHLSCPEAARLVLLHENLAIDGAESVVGENRYAEFTAQQGELSPDEEQSPHPRFAEIRRFLILLLRDRSYPIWERLFLIGLFANRLHVLIAGRETLLIPQLLADYADVVSSGSLRKVMDGIPARPAQQLAVVLQVIEMRMARILNSMRFLECTKEFLDGIGYRPGATPESLSPAYTAANRLYFKPLMETHPYLLENLVLNLIFKSVFPFGPTDRDPINPGPEKGKPGGYSLEYLTICAHYAVIKGLLIGIAGFQQESFNTDHVVKLVQSYGRMVEHNQQFVAEIVKFLAVRTMGSSDGFAMLLRN